MLRSKSMKILIGLILIIVVYIFFKPSNSPIGDLQVTWLINYSDGSSQTIKRGSLSPLTIISTQSGQVINSIMVTIKGTPSWSTSEQQTISGCTWTLSGYFSDSQASELIEFTLNGSGNLSNNQSFTFGSYTLTKSILSDWIPVGNSVLTVFITSASITFPWGDVITASLNPPYYNIINLVGS